MDATFLIELFQFFVSLTAIIGAFFYIHMGNWLQNVLKLENKWNIARFDASEEGNRAKFELQFELGEYQNPVFGLLIALVNLFLLFLVVLSLVSAVQIPDISDVIVFFGLPFWIFTLLFFITSVLIVIIGYRKLVQINREIIEWRKNN